MEPIPIFKLDDARDQHLRELDARIAAFTGKVWDAYASSEFYVCHPGRLGIAIRPTA